MAKVYLFNPENDLALAFGGANYSPPKRAVELRDSGSCLPAWMANAGDYIVGAGIDEAWLEEVDRQFGLGVKNFIPSSMIDEAVPWGWSPAAKAALMRYGVPSSIMPRDERLIEYRLLSHRRLSTAVNADLRECGLCVDLPLEAQCWDDVEGCIERYGRVMIKAPWSSSGRGIIDSGATSADLRRQVEGIIRHQGSVMVERWVNKVLDFAMLFTVDATGAHFSGLSLFGNSRGTAYAGNLVMPQDKLAQRIMAECDIDLADVAAKLRHSLTHQLCGCYEGNCGVDMMIAENEGRRMLVPCVEVNLRTTMGFVALSLASRFLADGSAGLYRIVQNDATIYDSAIVESHRLVSGTIDLTPGSGRFRFLFEASTADKFLQLAI